MSLTLKVLSFKGQSITEIAPVSFGNEGGSIGRSDDNTLVLPDKDKFVSRHHAQISYNNGFYYLSDNSMGGVYINGQQTPLLKETIAINHGTFLKVGEYELSVSITDEPVIDDFPFFDPPKQSLDPIDDFPFPIETPLTTPPLPTPDAGINEFEFLPDWEEVGSNSLMSGHFSGIEELVEQSSAPVNPTFESGLTSNQSPLSDSYQAPSITPPIPVEEIPENFSEIPENFSFDDFFSDTVAESPSKPQTAQPVSNSSHDDFDAFLGAAISEMSSLETLEINAEESLVPTPQADELLVTKPENIEIDTGTATGTPTNINKIEELSIPLNKPSIIKEKSDDASLLDDFIHGLNLTGLQIAPERQKETLNRVGQIFRKLIDGTIAVLRSRAEFKSLCRVNMTVISATNNNPLKFTVSTDDVLRKLLENNTEGFKEATSAIEESFSDIMNHQLAMQAGIQASLTDLLQSFDPKVIEKQFEQGIVLQKKSKCWDKFEETYRNTVEEAVENFYGDAFVKAYEQQIRQLTNQRKQH